jgi:poly(3-hydroxybutyrate) depolymerase
MNVDSSRIYATGFSNGAGFVNLLACVPDTAATFAAFSAGSAALYPGTRGGSGCNSNGTSISFLEFHGQNDGNAVCLLTVQ